jgi:PAS domain S-box-containing protein/putative nucleotidyltransferase with HDIG domain
MSVSHKISFNEIPSQELLETLPTAVTIIDHHGAIINANLEAETLFGYSRTEIIGKPVETLVPTSLKQVHVEHRKHYFDRPQKRPMGTRLALTALHRDGNHIPVDISLSPLHANDTIYIMAVIRDDTELMQAYEETLTGWSRAMDFRDKETEGHTLRVTQLSVQIARSMGLSETAITHIRRGALLHDIGKMAIPDDILNKPAKLTEQEWVIMRKHPEYAYEMLWPITFLRPALDIPYCHHEKWDGTGYPRGLKGEEIPLAARIFAVIDVWDALRFDRPYRKGWTDAQTRKYIRTQAGKHFDPQVVKVFLKLIP